MKITEIEVIPIKYPLEETVYWAQGPITERRMVLVKVKTDENIEGIGEAVILVDQISLPRQLSKRS